MKNIFNPEKIAIIGASRHESSVGHDILKNLLESKKKVYPVNPKAVEILGEKVYSSVLDIKGEIDLAVIVVPSEIVPKIMNECAEKKIKSVVIISAGFSEAGKKELEKEILKIANENGIRILGPNCLGFIVPESNLNASFFQHIPEKGEIAFISQSGALGVSVLDWAIKSHIGLSAFVSIGNAIDIGIPELIDYFEKDKKTKVICIYIESLKDGFKFIKTVSKAKKPIIILKSGSTKSGEKAAKTHTAALATEDKIYDGIFKQFKILRVENLYQMFEIAQQIVYNKIPEGPRGLIITNAGGPGVLASDAFEKNRLEVVNLPEKIVKTLDEKLPSHWSRNNPVDIIGDAKPERYKKTLDIFEKENFYDFLFLILTPQTMTDPEKVAKILAKFHEKTKTPCFSCFMGGISVSSAKKVLKKKGIINFNEPEYGAEVIGRMIK